MRIQPDFEKANEIYFRLGIIYKQQTKYQQSLEVSCLTRTKCIILTATVFPLYHQRPPSSLDGGRRLVPDRPCARAAKRCKYPYVEDMDRVNPQ